MVAWHSLQVFDAQGEQSGPCSAPVLVLCPTKGTPRALPALILPAAVVGTVLTEQGCSWPSPRCPGQVCVPRGAPWAVGPEQRPNIHCGGYRAGKKLTLEIKGFVSLSSRTITAFQGIFWIGSEVGMDRDAETPQRDRIGLCLESFTLLPFIAQQSF